jgi:hypothetical protein
MNRIAWGHCEQPIHRAHAQSERRPPEILLWDLVPQRAIVAEVGREKGERAGEAGQPGMWSIYQEPMHGGIGTGHLHVLIESVKSVGARSITDAPVIWGEWIEWGIWGGQYDSIRRQDPCNPRNTQHQAPRTKRQLTIRPGLSTARRAVWFVLVLALAIDVSDIQ